MQRIPRLQPGDEAGVARLHLGDRALVLVGVEVHVLCLAHQLVQDDGEIGDPMDLLDPGDPARLVLGELVAFPDGDELAGLTQEQDLAVLLVGRIREEHEDGLLLVHAGEPEQVGVGDQPERAVGVRGQDVVGIHDRERARQHQAGEAGAVLDEEPGRNRGMTHGEQGWAGSRGGGNNGARTGCTLP